MSVTYSITRPLLKRAAGDSPEMATAWPAGMPAQPTRASPTAASSPVLIGRTSALIRMNKPSVFGHREAYTRGRQFW
jgi:hypothetical protein